MEQFKKSIYAQDEIKSPELQGFEKLELADGFLLDNAAEFQNVPQIGIELSEKKLDETSALIDGLKKWSSDIDLSSSSNDKEIVKDLINWETAQSQLKARYEAINLSKDSKEIGEFIHQINTFEEEVLGSSSYVSLSKKAIISHSKNLAEYDAAVKHIQELTEANQNLTEANQNLNLQLNTLKDDNENLKMKMEASKIEASANLVKEIEATKREANANLVKEMDTLKRDANANLVKEREALKREANVNLAREMETFNRKAGDYEQKLSISDGQKKAVIDKLQDLTNRYDRLKIEKEQSQAQLERLAETNRRLEADIILKDSRISTLNSTIASQNAQITSKASSTDILTALKKYFSRHPKETSGYFYCLREVHGKYYLGICAGNKSEYWSGYCGGGKIPHRIKDIVEKCKVDADLITNFGAAQFPA